MKIKSLTIKGFKSFGNTPQTIKMNPDKGTLTLLQGKNGAGKSSIIDALDYVNYNKVKGKHKKVVKLSSLPNRINKELLVDINFESASDEIVIKRGQHPKILELYINGVDYLRAGNKNIDKKIEDYLDVDLETFKSFISMSINDFKNFMSLSNDEKKLLLDKLFNLEVINQMNDILKQLNSENRKQMDLYNREIETFENNINRIKRTISEIELKKKENLSEEMKEVFLEIEKLKDPYSKIYESIKTGKSKISEVEEEISVERDKVVRYKSEINQLNGQLKLYDNDKCPTCKSDLNSKFHLDIKDKMIESKSKYEEQMQSIIKTGTALKEKLTKMKSKLDSLNSDYRNTHSKIKTLESKYDELTKKKNEKKDSEIDEFFKAIKEIEDNKSKSEQTKSKLEDKEVYFKYLKEIFSEQGIKRSIIKNIIEPINVYVAENLEHLHDMPYEVVLDDTFTANVTSLGEEIDIETLSTGETKKINISILLAYLKLIRTKKNINVLFLDEVFSSVDIESINDVIVLLRKFATDTKLNIFLVHHSLLDSNHFDRIIKVEKDVFTTLTEIDE